MFRRGRYGKHICIVVQNLPGALRLVGVVVVLDLFDDDVRRKQMGAAGLHSAAVR